ncbi:hypothetical protein BC833DRAFT_527513 [Globomyces pollinis-pini]|nr:hypothetical protein BC833DRAFT_527513 [Globomyces pollinis-pini]
MIETKGKLKDTKPEESNGKEPISTHDEDLCTICANEFQWYGIGECNHPVCHICMLRMRALYKSTFCPICKTDCQTVIFTDHANQLFSTFNTTSFKRDKKLGIYFQTPVMYDETMVLLSFNCPDPECSTVCGGGWADLTNHVKKAHKSLLCQLCIKYKKVFTHESIMFSSEELRKHNKVGDPDADGFIGHPECGFCHVRYYSHDELYDHCREAHEQCFLCMRVGIQNQYYTNYEALEEHFGTEHFRCLESKCLEQKFVVFATEIDLHGHQVNFFVVFDLIVGCSR